LGKIFDALQKAESDKTLVRNVFDARKRTEPQTTLGTPTGPDSTHKEMKETTAAPTTVVKVHRHEKNNKTLRQSVEKPLDKNLITFHTPSSHEAEQFRILRTTLLFPTSGERPRTIMVTSALPGEGKSFVASNLAVSMAQNINEHVLLIDGDVRKPCQHTIFGFGDVSGLSEHLSDGMELSSLILKTEVNKLSILPGGKPPHNPSELLSSESMSSLIQETKARYNDRYIILDSPPPRLTSETGALARQVDGVIIVVNSNTTPKDMVEKLVELIDKEKILGIVMNRFDIRGSKYYGYGKYGYGAYGKKEQKAESRGGKADGR